MSKSIKITNEVYQELQKLQRPREPYSNIIARTISAYKAIQGIRDGLPPSHYLLERPKQEVKHEVS